MVFKLIASERPSNLDRVIARVDKERMEALEKVKAELVPIGKPVPNSNQPGFVSKNGPVKTNAAFILRADSVLQKHREKEVAAIENFESGLRDRYGLGAFPNPASLFAHTRTRRDVLPLP